jgi:replication-associated recombination protein RarA
MGDSILQQDDVSIIIANGSRDLLLMSAIDGGVAAIKREVYKKAKQDDSPVTAKSYTFIDEVHRFSKSQQDSYWVLLKSWITLVVPLQKIRALR